MTDGGHRDPEPEPKVCPSCLGPATPTTDYELSRTGKPWYCGGHGGLYFDGTATEAAHYAARKIADDAERGTIGPSSTGDSGR